MPVELRRYQREGHLHFVTFSCYRRLPFLNVVSAYACFERRLESLRQRHRFAVHGYVLMPEHVHLLLSEPEKHSLGDMLRVLKGQTSRELRGDREQLWMKRYYDFNVFTERKRVEKLRYMHRNPVVRGLVARPEDWVWSSFRHYATGERLGLWRLSHPGLLGGVKAHSSRWSRDEWGTRVVGGGVALWVSSPYYRPSVWRLLSIRRARLAGGRRTLGRIRSGWFLRLLWMMMSSLS